MPFVPTTCCEKPSALPWISIPGTTLSSTYVFQVLDKRYWCIYDYNRLKINDNGTFDFELEKPFYVFTPSKSETLYDISYSGKVPIIGYDHTTKTYSLSYNANSRKLYAPLGPNLYPSPSFDVKIKTKLLYPIVDQFAPARIENVGYANNTNTPRRIPIKTFSKELTSFTFNDGVSSLMNSIQQGTNVVLSGALYALNTPPQIYNFLIKIDQRNINTGEIFASEVIQGSENLNSTWLSSFSALTGDWSDNVGYVYLNTMTAHEDIFGYSFLVPTNLLSSNFTTTQLLTTNNNSGKKAPDGWAEPFKVTSMVPEYPLSSYDVTWDLTNGAEELTTLAKRNKLYITAYDCTTKTYSLSDKGGPGELFTIDNNFDSTYLYQWLYTRLYNNNQWKEVRIANINTNTGEIEVTEDINCESYVVPQSAGLRHYICDELLTVPDTAAGTLKIFRKNNNNTAEVLSSSLNFVFDLLSSSSYAPDIYTGLGRSRPFKDGQLARDSGGDNGELSGYSVPFVTYFQRNDYKARYWYPTPPGVPLPGQSNPEGRWQYSQKALFFDYKIRTAPLTAFVINIASYNLPEGNEPFYFNSKGGGSGLFQSTYCYQLSSTTNTPFRFRKQVVFINPYEYYLEDEMVPLSAGPPYYLYNPDKPTIVQTTYDTLCTLTSGYSRYAENVLSTDTHHFIIDPYTKLIHIYREIAYDFVAPWYVLTAPLTLDNTAITITNYGTRLAGKSYSDKGCYFAIAFDYYYNNQPGLIHNCVNIYNVPIVTGNLSKKPILMRSINSSNLQNTSASHLDKTIGDLAMDTITNRTNNKTTQITLMLSRPYNSYYQPTTGFIEFYNLIMNPPTLFYTLTNTREEYYLGTNIDINSNYAAVTLSGRNVGSQNLVNIYNLSAYTIFAPVPSPTPSITPSPTPTLAPIDINITWAFVPDKCVAQYWDGSQMCVPNYMPPVSLCPGFEQEWQIDGTYTSQIDEYGSVTGQAGRKYYKKIKSLDGVYTPDQIDGPAIHFIHDPWAGDPALRGPRYYLDVPTTGGVAAGIDVFTRATLDGPSKLRYPSKEGYDGWPAYSPLPPVGYWYYQFKSALCSYHWNYNAIGPAPKGIYLSAGEIGYSVLKIQMGKGNDVPNIPTPTPTPTPSNTPVLQNFCAFNAGYAALNGDYSGPTENISTNFYYSGPTFVPGVSTIAVEFDQLSAVPWRIYVEDWDSGGGEVDVYINLDSSHLVPTGGWISVDSSSNPAPSIYHGPCFTPSVTPTLTLTPSITPTLTLTPSITPTFTLTPSVTPTFTLTPTQP